MLLNQHKQSSLKIYVIFLENLVTKKLHHTEEWSGLFKIQMKIMKTVSPENFFALIFKMPKLSLNMKLDQNSEL